HGGRDFALQGNNAADVNRHAGARPVIGSHGDRLANVPPEVGGVDLKRDDARLAGGDFVGPGGGAAGRRSANGGATAAGYHVVENERFIPGVGDHEGVADRVPGDI